MHNKGQIASLDFILSVVVVVLALGLIMQTIEINQYTLKQTADGNDLEMIAETAADILITHPDSTCNLKDDQGNKIDDVIQCVYKKESDITKANLGIPDGYSCHITINKSSGGSGALNSNECHDPPVPSDAYTATRSLTYVGTGWQGGGGGDLIPKVKLLQDCIMSPSPLTDCKLEYATVSVSIWKV